ncbi:endonuclease III [bacterium]|nr:endonuclease III [bacterium]
MDIKQRIKKIIVALKKEYPNAAIPLKHRSALQLLIATILSAQCTDERVNKVTPDLFKKYKTVNDFANARQSELEKLIRSTGFFKNKSKNIIGCCQKIVEDHNGKIPQTLEGMVKLPGVGRKTANVVLGGVWNVPGVVVDTHVIRLTNLLKLTKNSDPVKIEFDLMKIVPEKDWNIFSLLLIFHGRKTCVARRPQCTGCVVNGLCLSSKV